MDRQWKETTRGGYWVRGVEPVDSEGEYYDLRGEVGNHSNQPPSEDPADWAWETWRSDGRYLYMRESTMDLMEVQDGTDNWQRRNSSLVR
jgi:hypothetical protein